MNSLSKKRNSKHIFYFDALRALAIIAVILVHVYAKGKYLTVESYGIAPPFKWFLSDFLGVCLDLEFHYF